MLEVWPVVHEQSLQDALEFLDIPSEQRSPIVWDTVLASIKALAVLYSRMGLLILMTHSTYAANQTFSRKERLSPPRKA